MGEIHTARCGVRRAISIFVSVSLSIIARSFLSSAASFLVKVSCFVISLVVLLPPFFSFKLRACFRSVSSHKCIWGVVVVPSFKVLPCPYALCYLPGAAMFLAFRQDS